MDPPDLKPVKVVPQRSEWPRDHQENSVATCPIQIFAAEELHDPAEHFFGLNKHQAAANPCLRTPVEGLFAFARGLATSGCTAR